MLQLNSLKINFLGYMILKNLTVLLCLENNHQVELSSAAIQVSVIGHAFEFLICYRAS